MHTLREEVLEPVVYHLNPAKTDNQQFRNIVRWIPSFVASYAAYVQKVCPSSLCIVTINDNTILLFFFSFYLFVYFYFLIYDVIPNLCEI